MTDKNMNSIFLLTGKQSLARGQTSRTWSSQRQFRRVRSLFQGANFSSQALVPGKTEKRVKLVNGIEYEKMFQKARYGFHFAWIINFGRIPGSHLKREKNKHKSIHRNKKSQTGWNIISGNLLLIQSSIEKTHFLCLKVARGARKLGSLATRRR